MEAGAAAPASILCGRTFSMSRSVWFLLVAGTFLSGAHPGRPTWAVKPYLQAGTMTGITVLWHSEIPRTARVEVEPVHSRSRGFGPAELWFQRQDALLMNHQLRIEGLVPGTAYRYRCFEGEEQVAEGTFKTLPAQSAASFRFAVLGDSGSGNANQWAVAKALKAWRPDFVLHTGDVIYERGEAENYKGRFFTPYRSLIGSLVFYPTIGNHDDLTDHAGPYQRFFEVPRSGQGDTERWYSFRAGALQFFALDTNVPFGLGSEQRAWLERELRASDARLRIAFFHHPPYSGGAHGSSLFVRKSFGPLFEARDVRVVFSGHDHHYERTRPREDFCKDGRPTTYFVTGGGGAWLRSVKSQPFTAYARSVYHFLGVTVDSGRRFRVEAIDTQGLVFDAWDLEI